MLAVVVERWQASVSHILRDFGLAPDPEAVARLAGWVGRVAEWNARIDLTAARSDAELADLMLSDAAMLAGFVEPEATLIDVGTGAGAPGLPLALLRPDLAVTLVEPMQKRVALLRLAVGQAGLGGRVVVERARGEAVEGRFGVAISRATLAPPDWLALGARLADEVWVLLAQGEPPQLEGWGVRTDHRYRWPLTGADRRALRFRRP